MLAGLQRNKQEMGDLRAGRQLWSTETSAQSKVRSCNQKRQRGGASYEKVIVPIIRHDGGWCDSAVCVCVCVCVRGGCATSTFLKAALR